ncbi:MAG TPA: hypothetical protein VGD91_11575 [Trebonia sp.]
MSSAILYLAIVAIWACVLIPRWLRRDTARSAAAPAAIPVPLGAPPAELDAEDADGLEPDADQDDLLPQAAEPPGPEETRRRMLAARRRLLLMLLGLEVAAVALAVLGLAAVWVVIPPTLMLGGYLLLLREAGQADAERASRDAELAVRIGERRRAGAQARRAAPAAETATGETPAEGTSTEGISAAAAALLTRFAAAPVPADYEDAPGRDFAPGLAGKYTAATADADQADEDYYGGYQAHRLRAVGD